MRTLARFLILFALIAPPTDTPAQSLVYNHDFETLTSTLPGWCPTSGLDIFKAAGWQTPGPLTSSSPDFYHTCGSPNYQVPSNVFGYEPDNAGGQAYAGGVLYSTATINREYLQAPLMVPLVAGATYNVSFDVSVAEASGLSIDNIGAYLGGSALGTLVANNYHIETPLPQVAATSIISNATGWTTISGQFVATGGEQFITIGVFGPQSATNSQVRSGLVTNGAVYYVDNVIVQPAVPDGRRYVTDLDDELQTVDTTTGSTCSVTTVGVTQDSPSGPIRHVRGLAYDGQTLWGMTREGDLVTVDRYSGQTQFVYSLTSAVPMNEYWVGLAYDGANTLYTSNTLNSYGPPQLVKLDISTNPPVETLIGTPSAGQGSELLFALAFYPQNGPTTPPTFSNGHPATGNLYGQSALLQGAMLLVDTSTAAVTPLQSPTFPPFDIQAFDFDPWSGYLEAVGLNWNLPGYTNEIYQYDFTTQNYSSVCTWPASIPSIAPHDSLTGSGMAFLPPTTSVQKTVMKLCVNGPSTNVPWQWWLQNFTAVVPALPNGDPETAIAQAFVQSLQSMGFTAWVDSSDPTCLNVLADPSAQLAVGPVNGPQCVVTNNPVGCAVNPTITEFRFLPVPHPVAVDGPNAPALARLTVHPNPFNPTTTIRFDLGVSGPVTVEILDLRGARVQVLVDETLDVGQHRVKWRGDDMRGAAVSSGVYLVRIRTAGESQTRKVALIR